MNSVSMVAAQRHLILNNMISSKVFSKSQCIYISKGEKLLSFHSPCTPPHTHSPPLKVTFISESVFLRVYLKVGLSRVMSHQHMFGTISGKVLGNHRKTVTQIGGFYINEHWFKQFWGRDLKRGTSTHFPLPGLHSFKCYFVQHDTI